MKTSTDSYYKHDDKRDLTPEELVKAKTACEFVINLTKAISRSGYYDSNHPVSQEVKRGLYDFFKNDKNLTSIVSNFNDITKFLADDGKNIFNNLSSITKDVADEMLVVGNPAKVRCNVREIRDENGNQIYPWKDHLKENRGYPWQRKDDEL